MKTHRLLSVIAVAALASGAAWAQTSTTTTTITTDQAAKVKTYVMKEQKPSVKFSGTVAVGTTLPADVEFYALPDEVGVDRYRYTVVNDRTVLVEPSTRKVIRIIE